MRERRGRRLRRRLALALLVAALFTGQAAWAGPAPRTGREGGATVAFDARLAARLRGARDVHALQKALGAPGRTEPSAGGGARAVYDWTGPSGRLRAFVYGAGDFGARVTFADGGEARFNNFGAFICPACAPPVRACGHRPAWVPHSLHWDDFDCERTVLGPQQPTNE